MQTNRQIVRRTGGQTDRQIYRQIVRQTDRQTDRQKVGLHALMDVRSDWSQTECRPAKKYLAFKMLYNNVDTDRTKTACKTNCKLSKLLNYQSFFLHYNLKKSRCFLGICFTFNLAFLLHQGLQYIKQLCLSEYNTVEMELASK